MQSINRIADFKKLIRLIGKDGRQIGLVTLSSARKLAKKQSASLVKITETSSPSIWRMTDRPKPGKKSN
jgi:translation initiation factor IF-3